MKRTVRHADDVRPNVVHAVLQSCFDRPLHTGGEEPIVLDAFGDVLAATASADDLKKLHTLLSESDNPELLPVVSDVLTQRIVADRAAPALAL